MRGQGLRERPCPPTCARAATFQGRTGVGVGVGRRRAEARHTCSPRSRMRRLLWRRLLACGCCAVLCDDTGVVPLRTKQSPGQGAGSRFRQLSLGPALLPETWVSYNYP